MLGDGEKHATPADLDDDQESVEDGIPGLYLDEWVDDGDEKREGVDVTVHGAVDLSDVRDIR